MNLSISNHNQPNATFEHQRKRESTILWALICSILLHIMFAVVIPKLKSDEAKKPNVLQVQLVAKPEAPAAVAEPEPVKPEEPKPIVTPTPVVKPLPKPIIKTTPDAQPIAEPVPQPVPQPAAVQESKPTSDAPTAKAEAAPAVTEPVKPTFSQVDINAAKDAYGDALWRAISKFKKYPNIAQRRSYEGEVILELLLDGNGKIIYKKVLKSSGYEILDNQALEMVDKAVPFPLPAASLRNNNFTIKIPVPFKLESP